MRISVAALAFIAGCASSEGAKPNDCAPGRERSSERCVARLDACGGNSVPIVGGGCQAVGVPVASCAEGFTHDAASPTCAAVLPSSPCGSGTFAWLGEAACHEVAPCGTGKWGAIPVDASTIYVDREYTGGGSDGSEARPFTTIASAVAAATGNPIVAIAKGVYEERLLIRKPVRLWGRCPADAEIRAPSGVVDPIVDFLAKGELHRVAVTRATFGVAVETSEGVLIDEVWVHDLERGIELSASRPAASATIRRTLVERARYFGITAYGANATIEQTVIRDVKPMRSDGFGGVGLLVRHSDSTGNGSEVTARGLLLERCHGSGISVFGSSLTLDGSLVRDIEGHPSDGTGGNGVSGFIDASTPLLPRLQMQGSVIERARTSGVFLQSSTATIEATVVRDTRASRMRDGGGFGISATQRSNLTIRDSTLLHNGVAGLGVVGSQATIERLFVNDTVLGPTDGGGLGVGLALIGDGNKSASQASVRDSLFAQSHGAGIFVSGSKLELFESVVRDSHPTPDGLFGDGLFVAAEYLGVGPPRPGEIDVDASWFLGNPRAGLNVAGSKASLRRSKMTCNGFALSVGRWYESDVAGNKYENDVSLNDQGDNSCGCEAPKACTAATSALEPIKWSTPK